MRIKRPMGLKFGTDEFLWMSRGGGRSKSGGHDDWEGEWVGEGIRKINSPCDRLDMTVGGMTVEEETVAIIEADGVGTVATDQTVVTTVEADGEDSAADLAIAEGTEEDTAVVGAVSVVVSEVDASVESGIAEDLVEMVKVRRVGLPRIFQLAHLRVRPEGLPPIQAVLAVGRTMPLSVVERALFLRNQSIRSSVVTMTAVSDESSMTEAAIGITIVTVTETMMDESAMDTAAVADESMTMGVDVATTTTETVTVTGIGIQNGGGIDFDIADEASHL
jgi:hypothetical protein